MSRALRVKPPSIARGRMKRQAVFWGRILDNRSGDVFEDILIGEPALSLGEWCQTSSDIFETSDRELPPKRVASEFTLATTGSRQVAAQVGVELVVESNSQGRHVRQRTAVGKMPQGMCLATYASTHVPVTASRATLAGDLRRRARSARRLRRRDDKGFLLVAEAKQCPTTGAFGFACGPAPLVVHGTTAPGR